MDSTVVLRSFQCSAGAFPRSLIERPGTTWPNLCKSHTQGFTLGGHIVSSPAKWKRTPVSCVKSPEAPATAKSDSSSNGNPQGSLEKKKVPRSATFPSGFEALVLEVCDETEIAELQLKVGDFEMHLKRNIGATVNPIHIVSPTTPPPVPTKPMVESATTAPPPSPPKPSPEKTSSYSKVSVQKSPKLVALEASGSTYVLVLSPTVGSFRRGRTIKGKKQPPICKEGDVIKEGQVIGYLDQFGTELPIKSDVAGEVLKLLFDDGEAVGYGEPLIAVLPSFHGIK